MGGFMKWKPLEGSKTGTWTLDSAQWSERRTTPFDIDRMDLFKFRCDCGRTLEIWQDELPTSQRQFIKQYPCACGSGVAATKPNRKNKAMSISINPEIAQWIESRAWEKRQTKSAVVEELLIIGISNSE